MANPTGKGGFQKGRSGNPGGRPKVNAHVEALAREMTPEAINTLSEVMRGKKNPPAARVSAAVALLDRGWGKPRQDSNVTVRMDPDQMSDADLAAIIAKEQAMLAGEEDSGSVH